ncbi:MAG TPA: hypothetical protein VGD56_18990 [Gemmatirosa sp.]
MTATTKTAHDARAEANAVAARRFAGVDDDPMFGAAPIRKRIPSADAATPPLTRSTTVAPTSERAGKNKGGRKPNPKRELVRARHSVALNATERERIDNVARALAQSAPRAGFSEAVRLLVEVGLQFVERESVLVHIARTPESRWIDTILTLSGSSARQERAGETAAVVVAPVR